MASAISSSLARAPAALAWRLARAFLGRGRLKPGADRIALGPKRLDLDLRGAHLGVEREQSIKLEIDPLGGDRFGDRIAVRSDETMLSMSGQLRETGA